MDEILKAIGFRGGTPDNSEAVLCIVPFKDVYALKMGRYGFLEGGKWGTSSGDDWDVVLWAPIADLPEPYVKIQG
jgi:hypothetical protein